MDGGSWCEAIIAVRKGWLPSGPALVRLYLKVPLAWKVMGAQAFMVGRPAAGSD